MSDTTKLVIVVLAAIVVLFLVGIGAGAFDGIQAFTVDGIASTFGGQIAKAISPALSLDELSASPSDCLRSTQRRIVVQNLGACVLTVAPSDATVRSLTLQIVSGTSVHIDMTVEPVKDKTLDIKSDLPSHGSDEITLTFFRSDVARSATISLCTSASGCMLKIVD